MDPIKNPFSPGAGSPPPVLVGRDPILEQASILLGRIKQKRPEKSILLTGLRGVGKTVLLNAIERMAIAEGYHAIPIEAHEDKPLRTLIALHLRRVLFKLDRIAGAGDRVERGFAILKSFVGSLEPSVHDISIGMDIEPEKGTADSGDLEIDLPSLLAAVGEAAEDRQSAVAMLIDEVHYLNQQELSALIMAMHRIQQRQLPIVLLGAGLPVLPAVAGESKSYADQLFSFLDVGPLSASDTAKALRDPAAAAGVSFEPSALDEIFRLTKGYPYFVQEWGYNAWNLAPSSPITKEIVTKATATVIAPLDTNFLRGRYDRLTPREKNVLRALAELGPGPQRTSEVADALRIRMSSLGPLRAELIKKGMIYSPAHGDMAFTVPLFGEFMTRAVPGFKTSVDQLIEQNPAFRELLPKSMASPREPFPFGEL